MDRGMMLGHEKMGFVEDIGVVVDKRIDGYTKVLLHPAA
jgi:hypothetical protein